MSMLESAIRVAVDAHEGQLDKQGEPYILHPLRVMQFAAEAYKLSPLAEYSLEEVMVAAILHDVAEDTNFKLPQIYAGFGPKVHAIVDGLTRRKELGESYKEYVLRAKQNPGSRLIKRHGDIRDHLNRIDGLPIKEQSIRGRYENAVVVLDAPDAALEEMPSQLGSHHESIGHEHLESQGSKR